jgi:hypothetical protein
MGFFFTSLAPDAVPDDVPDPTIQTACNFISNANHFVSHTE